MGGEPDADRQQQAERRAHPAKARATRRRRLWRRVIIGRKGMPVPAPRSASRCRAGCAAAAAGRACRSRRAAGADVAAHRVGIRRCIAPDGAFQFLASQYPGRGAHQGFEHAQGIGGRAMSRPHAVTRKVAVSKQSRPRAARRHRGLAGRDAPAPGCGRRLRAWQRASPGSRRRRLRGRGPCRRACRARSASDRRRPCRRSSRRRRHSVMPSIPGRIRSSRITSNSWLLARCRPVRPSPAASTRWPAGQSKSTRLAARSGLSSTTRMLSGRFMSWIIAQAFNSALATRDADNLGFHGTGYANSLIAE
jgi:hypothetical protein